MAVASFHIRLENATDLTLSRTSLVLKHGEWSGNMLPPETILRKTAGEWQSESSGFATGTEGSVTYAARRPDGFYIGDVYVHWNIPFTGHGGAVGETPTGNGGPSSASLAARGDQHGGTADEGWEIYDEQLPFAGALYGPQRVRMAAVGLGGGGLLVVTPGAPAGEAIWEPLARWGTPRFLLAPNHFHNLGIAAWKERFPTATVVAHPRALARLRKRLKSIPVEDLTALEAALPEGMRLLSPPMAKQGETWVSLKTSEGTGWFVTDGLLNEERLPGGPLGLLMRILGFRAGLQTNPFFKRVFLSDKAAYKAWVHAELDRDRPTLFVPSHGAVLRGPDVVSRIREATEAA